MTNPKPDSDIDTCSFDIYRADLEKKESIVKMVNRLLAQSFGKRWKGNIGFEDDALHLDYLELIVKMPFRFNPFGKYIIAGTFDYPKHFPREDNFNHDGSEIVVRPKYLEQAKKYATLYKAETGRTVMIVVDKSIPT